MWKGWLIGLAAVVALMNAARVDRTNTPVHPSESIEAHTQMPPNVAAIFRRACHNCHSEQTDCVAPVHWLVTADVYGARERLNLSKWGRYTPEERTDRLISICEMVASNRMPLWYYKPLHYPDAWLSSPDRKAVCDWVKTQVQLSAAR